MDNISSWIWVLIPLAAIGIAPFKMWIRVKEKQIESQTNLTAEITAAHGFCLPAQGQHRRVVGRQGERHLDVGLAEQPAHRLAARHPHRQAHRKR